jgi:hypothetical protein
MRKNLFYLTWMVLVLLGCQQERMERDDNPSARAEWQFEREMDNGGKVPQNIRERELLFAKHLPKLESAARGEAQVKSIGPFNVGGRTRAFAMDIDDEDIWMAGGVSGSLWRSEDEGLSWVQVGSKDATYTISSIVQDTRPGKTNIWYYGTGEGEGQSSSKGFSAIQHGNGVYKSTDGGLTWSGLDSTQSNTLHQFDNWDFVWRLAIDPSNTAEDEIYAAIAGGIMRSTDGGQNWTRVLGSAGGSFFNMGHTDVIVADDGTVFAALGGSISQNGIWRSTDGVSWTKISDSSFPFPYNRMIIALAPSNQNVLYVLLDSPGNGVPADPNEIGSTRTSFMKYTYLSGDGSGSGGNWENRSNNLPSTTNAYTTMDHASGYNMALRVYPNDENIVFVGGTNLFRSDDGFATRFQITQLGGYNPNFNGFNTYRYPNQHPDQHDVVFYRSNPNKMVSVSDGGVHLTNGCLANNVSWFDMNNGYLTTQFYTVAIDPTGTNDVIVGGLQDNGCWWTNTGVLNSWVSTTLSDGAYTAVEPGTDASGAGYYYFSSQYGVVYRYQLDGGGQEERFRRISPDEDTYGFSFVNPFVTDINNPDVMYMAYARGIIRHNTLTNINLNGSSNPLSSGWTTLSFDLGGGNHRITSMSVSRQNPNHTLYVGTNSGKIYRFDNASTGDPTEMDISITGLNAGQYVSSISVHPYDASKLLATTSNYNTYSIFYSKDGGLSWARVAGNLEEPLAPGVPDLLNGIGAGPSVRTSAIVPTPEGEVYLVGTSIGLYATTKLDSTRTIWYQQSPGELGNSVVDFLASRPTDGFVAIGTHGSGVYSVRFNDPNVVSPVEEMEVQELKLELFPNPSAGSVELKGFEGAAQAVLYDIRGVEVWSGQLDGAGPMDFSSFSAGTYFLSVMAEGASSVQKLVLK